MITLAVDEATWTELRAWVQDPIERAGILSVRVIDDADGTTLLARTLEAAPDESYLDRRSDGLALRSSGWVHAVRRAGTDGSAAMFVHTHPGGHPAFSEHDDRVDDDLYRAFQDLTGVGLYGALVLAGGRDPGQAARLRRIDGAMRTVDTIRVVGDRITVHRSQEMLRVDDDVHDRQIRALGIAGQSVLQNLRVGVVGAGGTGSPVIEQLARLGVGDIVAIDDDVVTPSTVARCYGSKTADIGRPKVDVVSEHVSQLGLDVTVRPVRGNIRERAVVEELRHRDVVFCCVDGHAGRIVLNRWAHWHIAPVIDLAVLVSSTAGRIDGVNGRITWLAPGNACLLCRGRIDPRLAHVEHLDADERRLLAEQGYAPGLDEPEASVVTYTSLVASVATSELLSRLFGLAEPEANEILIRILEHASSRNRRSPRAGCFCADPATRGGGLVEPYLDLTWAS